MSTVTVAAGPSSAEPIPMSGEKEQQSQTPFARVTQNLLAGLGIPLEKYLNSPPAPLDLDPDDPNEDQSMSFAEGGLLPGFPSMAQQESAQASAETSKDIAGVPVDQAVTRLHQACQHALPGHNEVLKFDFVQDEATRAWSCTLIIKHPHGPSETYTCGTYHAKQSEAKARTCAIAIEKGAMNFIVTGNAEGSPRKATAAMPATTSNASSATDAAKSSADPIKQIERCCAESGDARPKLDWIPVSEPKFGRTQGYALRVWHSAHVHKVYSVDTTYESPTEAQKACAEVALEEGVLDYIKHGRSEVEAADTSSHEPDMSDAAETWTVQRFYDELPQPVPDTIVGKTAADINSPAWLNMAIQGARGAKLTATFIWTADAQSGLHGCLLRLSRPRECKSYLVDAKFGKRNEAKAAVCLLAMSQGVGTWIRQLSKDVDNRLSLEVRKQVNDVLLPALVSEYRKVRPGATPAFDFHTVQDACGCTLTVELSATPSSEQTRTYSVDSEYKNRNDAKIAVVWEAVQQGVMEFITFRGQPPPPGYAPFYHGVDALSMNTRKRRYDWADGDKPYNTYRNNSPGWDGQFKKPRLNGPIEGNFSNNQRGVGRGFRGRGWNNNRGSGRYRNDQPWMAPRIPGPGEGGYVAGPPFMGPPSGQFQPGPGVSAYGFAQPAPQPFVPPQNGAYPQNYGAHGYAHSATAPPPPSPYQTPPAVGGAPYYGGAAQPSNAYPSYYPSAAPPAPVQYTQQPHTAPAPAANPYAAYAQPQVPMPQPYTSTVSQAPVYYPTPPAHYPSAAVQPVYNPVMGQYYAAPSLPPYARPPDTVPQTTTSTPTPPTSNPQQVSSTQMQQVVPAPVPAPVPTTIIVPATARSLTPAPAPTPAPVSAPAPPAAPAISVVPELPAAPAPVPALSPAPSSASVSAPTLAPPPLPATSLTSARVSASPTVPQKSPVPSVQPQAVAVPISSENIAKRARSTPKTPGHRTPTGTGKVAVSVESAPKSSVTALYDHCRTSGLPTPQFCHEIVKEQADMKHKVWVVIGKQKLELPVTFSSLSQGQERVSKRVLEQLRSQSQSQVQPTGQPDAAKADKLKTTNI